MNPRRWRGITKIAFERLEELSRRTSAVFAPGVEISHPPWRGRLRLAISPVGSPDPGTGGKLPGRHPAPGGSGIGEGGLSPGRSPPGLRRTRSPPNPFWSGLRAQPTLCWRKKCFHRSRRFSIPPAWGRGRPSVFRYALSLARKYQARIAVVYGLEPLRPAGQAVVQTLPTPRNRPTRPRRRPGKSYPRPHIRQRIVRQYERT